MRGSIWGESSFQDNGTTITDLTFDLEWQKEDDDTARNWEDALSYCETLSLDGDTDWRLPNVKELWTVFDPDYYNPTIDSTFFPNTNTDMYWSSTTNVNNYGSAWHLRFSDGLNSATDKTGSSAYVRCVREVP